MKIPTTRVQAMKVVAMHNAKVRIKRTLVSATAAVGLMLCSGLASAADGETLLLHQPTASDTKLAFVYAGDIWVSDRNGDNPHRLTVHPGVESDPYFSPDGKHIAFTAFYGGNYDVFMIPVGGGEPQQLTFHPGHDMAQGWTPDSKRVLFSSNRNGIKPKKQYELFTISTEGGFPEPLPMPVAYRGTFSPDASYVAYTPIKDPPFGAWKRYRGGMTPPIWLFDLESHDIEKVPHDGTNDVFPMWINDTVYFVSDRNYIANIFSYDRTSKAVTQLTFHETFDVKHASVSGSEIVYEQAGRLHLLDPAEGTSTPLSIHIDADQPDARPHWVDVRPQIEIASISPAGSQTLYAARGDVFVVANKSGDIRNLTRSSSAHERDPVWSPDGKRIAYLSDASGEYQLVLHTLKDNVQEVIDLDPGFYSNLDWAPDGSMLSMVDKRRQLMVVSVSDGKVRVIDQDTYSTPPGGMAAEFSPDSRWIAYTRNMENRLRALFLYDTRNGVSHRVTDSMADVSHVVFDREGNYLYLLASIDYGPKSTSLNISALGYQQTYRVFSLALGKETLPRLGPQEIAGHEPDVFSTEDQEDTSSEKSAGKTADTSKVANAIEPIQMDLEGLQHRMAPLPIEPGTYGNMAIAFDGSLLLIEYKPAKYASDFAGATRVQTLQRFDFEARETNALVDEITAYRLSRDGNQVLVLKGEDWLVVPVAKPDEPKTIDLSALRAYVEPREEWQQMFDESWRILRDHFYDENMHGLDWVSLKDRYTPFLEHMGHRSDLDFLIRELQGELVVGHAYLSPGDEPGKTPVPVGLLGADFEIDKDQYRIRTIYSGEDWNADIEAPLDRIGLKVAEGDYLLAVNDQPLDASINIFSLLGQTVGQETALLVSRNGNLKDARTVHVKPVDDRAESKLRLRHWVEGNRRMVDRLTDGKVAYIHLPDTADWGYAYFNRYFFSQMDKQAVIIDDRSNDGGYVSDYFINRLDAPLLSYWAHRDGQMLTSPGGIFGPKVMLIDETAGSGGDALPHFFRRRGIGPLIGKRTWGGLVGISSYPVLLDGGRITAPHFAIVSPEGEWEVENVGVAPDIEVEQTPKLVIDGHDPQLEKGIEVVLELLEESDFELMKDSPKADERALE